MQGGGGGLIVLLLLRSCHHPHLIIRQDLTCNSSLVLLFDLLFSSLVVTCYTTSQSPLLGIKSISDCAIFQIHSSVNFLQTCQPALLHIWMENILITRSHLVALTDHCIAGKTDFTWEHYSVLQQQDLTLNCIWQASCLIWTTRKGNLSNTYQPLNTHQSISQYMYLIMLQLFLHKWYIFQWMSNGRDGYIQYSSGMLLAIRITCVFTFSKIWNIFNMNQCTGL